ncbi:MAG: hypothetical protein J6R83_00095 [Clostridia bacterium]|nr:hypothetical protein [Clostridia bacterium]
MKSKLITVSAVSTALVAISLTVGAYFEVADLFSLVLASAFVVIPFYFNSVKASFLTYLAGGTIAVILSGFNFAYSLVFPSYFAYFGIFPIVFYIINNKRTNKPLMVVLGLIWTIAVFYGMFYYYTMVMGLDLSTMPNWMPVWVKDAIEYLIGVIAIIFYFIYQRYVLVVRYFFARYLDRIFNR